ncbi:MAG: acyl transferase [Bacteroidota bacterium]
MSFSDSFKKSLLSIEKDSFESHSLALFSYQFHSCPLYQHYCHLVGKRPSNVSRIQEIPFLPIAFFKNHAVKSGTWKEEKIFLSSGTTNSGRSKHYVKTLDFYFNVAKKAFEQFYGNLKEIKIHALLPSYQEQGDSSLIAMVDDFMSRSLPGSRYFLNEYKNLNDELLASKEKKILLGVSYALLDYAATSPSKSENLIVMETGGMKGRRKEVIREDLHNELKDAFGVAAIHSEYGMTELFSQAYGENGFFKFPKWADVLIRDINDPFTYKENGETGGMNIIDLANVDSCAFIETKDLGRKNSDSFEVLGRFDNSDVRGCNLMF